MIIETRRMEGILLLDLFGPFPTSEDEYLATEQAVCDALAEGGEFVIVLHGMEYISSREIGLLLRWLRAGKVSLGMLGGEPRVQLVIDNSIREVLNVTDSCFQTFATEEAAIASLHRQ